MQEESLVGIPDDVLPKQTLHSPEVYESGPEEPAELQLPKEAEPSCRIRPKGEHAAKQKTGWKPQSAIEEHTQQPTSEAEGQTETTVRKINVKVEEKHKPIVAVSTIVPMQQERKNK